MKSARMAMAAGGLVLLCACEKPRAPEAKPVRPVLSMVVAQSTVNDLELPGVVQPRVQTAVSFRVIGRLIARPVNVGDHVEKGQILAAIDSTALELAVRAGAADLSNSQAQFVNASGAEERQGQLLKTDSTTQALYDSAEESLASARAGVTRAEAALDKAKEQLGYAIVRSDYAGVITAVGAEVGQVVSPGKSVANVADPDLRDAVIDVPDAFVGALKLGIPFTVALQLDPAIAASGEIREIAPESDATTRTRRIKIALDKPPNAFRLGSTVTARLAKPGASFMRLPASALLEKNGREQVWIVDPASLKVSLRDVKILRKSDDVVVIASGLDPAMRVVTAGVHTLVEGESVKIYGEPAP
jgi:membrane fusion protein, multidrug efflux system